MNITIKGDLNNKDIEKILLEDTVRNYYIILDLRTWIDNGYRDIDQLNKKMIVNLFNTYGGDLYNLNTTLKNILKTIKDLNMNAYNTLVKYL